MTFNFFFLLTYSFNLYEWFNGCMDSHVISLRINKISIYLEKCLCENIWFTKIKQWPRQITETYYNNLQKYLKKWIIGTLNLSHIQTAGLNPRQKKHPNRAASCHSPQRSSNKSGENTLQPPGFTPEQQRSPTPDTLTETEEHTASQASPTLPSSTNSSQFG